jgi:hypothetical protein
MAPAGAGCVDRGHADWTFIDFSPRCSGTGPYGMYIALYQRGIIGVLEAFDTYVNPKIAFPEFVAGVLQRNGGQVFALTGNNKYVTTIGTEIEFTISPDSRIVAISNGPPTPNEGDFGSGTIISSSGQSGIVTVTNPYLGQSFTLDDHDASHPSVTLKSAPPLTADSCRAGFVWRQANAGDHICVLAATRSLTELHNQMAPQRRAGGGAFGPDTCKQGFVWREAFAADHVCVPPAERAQADFDDRLAASRRAVPPG